MEMNAMSINVSRTDKNFEEEKVKELLSSVKVLKDKSLYPTISISPKPFHIQGSILG
jgi:hypothetical protein